MIISKLINYDYYLNKLPLYLQDSSTFPEHFKIWFELLTNVDSYGDEQLNLVNIFDVNYLNNYGNICDEFLDLLGKLYGVARNLIVNIEGIQSPLNLSQYEFLILIKAQIIKNFWDGTRKTLEDFYYNSKIPIVSITDDSAMCRNILVLNYYTGWERNSNLHKLYKAGFLTIESLGIYNTYADYDETLEIGIWGQSRWSQARWAK